MKMKHLWRTLLCAIMIAALMAAGVWAEEEPIVKTYYYIKYADDTDYLMHTYNTNHGQISTGDPVEVRSEGPKSYDDKYTYCICDECQFWNMQGINDPYYSLI